MQEVQALVKLLAGMDRLESPHFKLKLDQAWKAMMEAALPDMEELVWTLEKLQVDLAGVRAKRMYLEGNKQD